MIVGVSVLQHIVVFCISMEIDEPFRILSLTPTYTTMKAHNPPQLQGRLYANKLHIVALATPPCPRPSYPPTTNRKKKNCLKWSRGLARGRKGVDLPQTVRRTVGCMVGGRVASASRSVTSLKSSISWSLVLLKTTSRSQTLTVSTVDCVFANEIHLHFVSQST